MEKSLLAIGLVTAGLCTAAFTNAEKINKLVSTTAKAVTHMGDAIKKQVLPVEPSNKSTDPGLIAKGINTDTTKNRLKIFYPAEIGDNTCFQVVNNTFITKIYKEAGTLYQLNYRHNVLVSMQVNGKTIPTDQVTKYQPVIDRIPHASNNDNAHNNDNVVENANDGQPAYNASNYYMANKKLLSPTDSANVKPNAGALRITGMLQSLSPQQQKLNELKNLAIADSVNSVYKKAPGYDGKWTKENKQYTPKSANGYYAKPYAPVAPKQPKGYKSYASPKNEEQGAKMINDMLYDGKLKDDERRDKMINDLMKDGIISTKDNLSFKISNSEFIINGKRQPDNVLQKYSQKYVKQYNMGQGEWSWLYNYDANAKRESNTVVDNNKN